MNTSEQYAVIMHACLASLRAFERSLGRGCLGTWAFSREPKRLALVFFRGDRLQNQDRRLGLFEADRIKSYHSCVIEHQNKGKETISFITWMLLTESRIPNGSAGAVSCASDLWPRYTVVPALLHLIYVCSD